MADNVKFKNWQCHDDKPVICREEAIKRTLGFAGIHTTQVLNALIATFAGVASLSEWEDSEGTWSIVSETLQGVGGGAAQWYKIRHQTEIEPGFVITFDKTGDRGMFIFACDDDYTGYYFVWTGTVVSMGEMVLGVTTDLVVLPCAETGDATVTVMVWPQQHTSVDEIDDLTCSLWFDDKLLLTHVVEYDATKGKKIGLGVYESDTITFDNIRVPQLHQIVSWTSVDPSEAASAGMSRVIAQSMIRVQARYDGAVKIWRNDTTTSDWTAPAARGMATVKTRQIFWPTHLRLVGALHEADVFRTGTQGHIFGTGQDPNALSEDATQDVADDTHKIAEEFAQTLGLILAPNPVIEPEDIITYDGDKWRVTSINYRVAWLGGITQGAPVLESQITTRECKAS